VPRRDPIEPPTTTDGANAMSTNDALGQSRPFHVLKLIVTVAAGVALLVATHFVLFYNHFLLQLQLLILKTVL